MRGFTGVAIAAAALLYPLLLWLLIDHVPGIALVGLFAAIALARLLALDMRSARRWALTVGIVSFCALAAWAALADPELQLLRLYPVLVSVAGGVWFAWTLTTSRPAAARLAALAGMAVPTERDGYLRVVTAIWVGFFALNATVSSWTAIAASPAVWSLYNGVLSYLAMGVLFLGEYLVRLRVQARERAVEATDQPVP